MYRPQFVFPPAGKGCRDVKCHYSFDFTNSPALGSIPDNNSVNQKIPLILDQDADFFLRAIQVYPDGNVGPTADLQIGLLDCFNNQLLDPLVPGNPPVLYPYLCWSSSTGGIVTLDGDDWGVYCPAGGAFSAYIQNTSGSPLSVIINLYGIKRYRGEQCF